MNIKSFEYGKSFECNPDDTTTRIDWYVEHNLISVSVNGKNFHDDVSLLLKDAKESALVFEDLQQFLKEHEFLWFTHNSVKVFSDTFDKRDKIEKTLNEMTKEELISYISEGKSHLKIKTDDDIEYLNLKNFLKPLGDINFINVPRFNYYSESGDEAGILKSYENKGLKVNRCYKIHNLDDSIMNILTQNKNQIFETIVKKGYNYIYYILVDFVQLTFNTTGVQFIVFGSNVKKN